MQILITLTIIGLVFPKMFPYHLFNKNKILKQSRMRTKRINRLKILLSKYVFSSECGAVLSYLFNF